MFTIYLVEDEERLRKLLTLYLEKEGYAAKGFSCAEDALKHLRDGTNLWLLDIGLPGMDGLELLKHIRSADQEVPVIFTSARDSEVDRVMGLHMGSDDYVTKPFSVEELLLRVKKLLARIYKTENNIAAQDGYSIDFSRRTVYEENAEIKLTSKEFELLEMFIKRSRKAYSREEILDFIWGEDYVGTDRVVDDTIRRLRKKMPRFSLETIYGYGYRLS